MTSFPTRLSGGLSSDAVGDFFSIPLKGTKNPDINNLPLETDTPSGSGALATTGVGSQAMVGASIAAGAMSTTGVGSMGMTGAARAAGAIATTGVGYFNGTGAMVVSGALSALGVGYLEAVGSDGANYQSGAWSTTGVGTMTMGGAAIASGAMQSSSTSTVDWRAEAQVVPDEPVDTTDPGPGGGVKSGYTWSEAERRRRERQERKRALIIAAVKGMAPAVFQAMSRPTYIHINRTLH